MARRARVAIIGAGIAGAACARVLTDAGHSVQLFDKSRGVGGRMATRRATWAAADGGLRESSFDHGVPAFTARSPDFVRLVENAGRDGRLSRWMPVMAPGSAASSDGPAQWVPTPDMPALCRAILGDVPIQTACTIDSLMRRQTGWSVASAGGIVADGFSDVVVAIPPPQAAPLLEPHRPDWAQRAQALPMAPCWTLMGVTIDVGAARAWDLALPGQGPLFSIVRNDAKPGRERLPGLDHWVVHADAAWSRTHLESPVVAVQAELQDALVAWLGRSLTWCHAAVHRWRYASVPPASSTASPASAAFRCWWDAGPGLGVCGDALGGGGVEGAWTSGRAVAAAIVDRYRALPVATGMSVSSA